MIEHYHSALGRAVTRWPAIERHEGSHGVAFRHDISEGVPPEFDAADVWYSDLPWRQGWSKFAERAGAAQQQSYDAMLEMVGRTIRQRNKPAVMVTGRHAVETLAPDNVCSTWLNGGDAVACLWRADPWDDTLDAVRVLRALAGRYACVGDFCCGYGRAGKVFAAAGKRYVMADLNAECVGYIATHAHTWA